MLIASQVTKQTENVPFIVINKQVSTDIEQKKCHTFHNSKSLAKLFFQISFFPKVVTNENNTISDLSSYIIGPNSALCKLCL